MKRTFLALAVAGVGLLASCASPNDLASTPPARIPGDRGPGAGYDDRLIAKIQRGETVESQLLEWFGYPECREVKPDGRAQLSWSLSRRTDGGPGHSGSLNVSLTTEGKVEAYAARGGKSEENRTVDFVAKSEVDLREQIEQWRREGWNVLNVSAPRTEADGTVHRKAELSRGKPGNVSAFGYDDRLVARIRRGETAESQLLEWFGPASSRKSAADGRAQLAWKFERRTDGGRGRSGELVVSLAPEGKVDSYSARRGPE